jgi:hypothetical protein
MEEVQLFIGRVKKLGYSDQFIIECFEEFYKFIQKYRKTVIAHLYVLVDKYIDTSEKTLRSHYKTKIKNNVLGTRFESLEITNKIHKDFFMKLLNRNDIDFNNYTNLEFNQVLYLVELEFSSGGFIMKTTSPSEPEPESEYKNDPDKIDKVSYNEFKALSLPNNKHIYIDEISVLKNAFNFGQIHLFNEIWEDFKNSKLNASLKDKSKIRYKHIYRIYIFHLMTKVPFKNILYVLYKNNYGLIVKLLCNIDNGKLSKSLEGLFDNFLSSSKKYEHLLKVHNDNKTLKVKIHERFFQKFNHKLIHERTNEILETHKNNHSLIQKKLYSLVKELDYKITNTELSEYIIKYYQ